MLDLIQITNDPALARRCDAIGGMRLFVDLERHGKAQRQAGRNTFISDHTVQDVGRIRRVLRATPLMVRVNPLHDGSRQEVDAVLAEGAQLLMLPMFTQANQVQEFCAMVAGRAPVVALLETAGALETLDSWVDTRGLWEVFVGLNDLHLSLGQRFMFEPLADGLLDRVAESVARHGVRFGFGGIARQDEGLLPGRDVLAEHVRLNSGAVILSRTFHREDGDAVFEDEVRALRDAERELLGRDRAAMAQDAVRIAAAIRAVAARLCPVR
jgi:hypothetical protein